MALRGRVHPRHIAFCAMATAILALVGAALSPMLTDRLPAGLAGHAGTEGVLDSDLDGIPDAIENYRIGSDPHTWNTAGTPIPDGWLARFGYDVLDPSVASRPAQIPPADTWPASFKGSYPDGFTASLLDVYRHARPGAWDEATDGPWDSGLDPRVWDTSGDGIPDGFLLHHGLDPFTVLAGERLAGPSGLTVAQAYQYGTDPTRLDSDGDGILDAVEIAGPPDPGRPGQRFAPTNPRAFSTAGTGICDGWLVHHGLDPNDTGQAHLDLDRDGATTLEEYEWGAANLSDPCSGGLDPRDAYSGGASVPDGWLIRHGLDPLQSGVADKVTQRASDGPGPAVDEGLDDLHLTVQDEYRANRPHDWDEALDGPWWGGTDPGKADTDGDGLGDAWEVRGYLVQVRTEVGPGPTEGRHIRPDPTAADTDGDGLPDLDEVLLSTDATRRDTDMDGILDADELGGQHALDPNRADTAGDFLRDGDRLALLQQRVVRYTASLVYEFSGPADTPRLVTDWLAPMTGAGPLTLPDVVALVGPGGDVDADNVPNILDPDMDGDGLLNGWEADPRLYEHSSFGVGTLPGGRSATDPLNPDTDGDGLADAWEVRYGVPDLQLLRHDPDPALWDTDGDGVADGEEDPDDDSIEYLAYRRGPAGLQPVFHAFTFDNLAEQAAGTDPHRFDTDGDGLSDGWKVFWGVTYPSMDVSGLGDHYPGAPGPLAIDAAWPTPVPGVHQAGVDTAAVPLETLRFAPAGGDEASLLRPNEIVVQRFFDVDTSNGGKIDILAIHGSWPMTFLDHQEALSNPYMVDSDGDGMPDHWEWVHRRVPLHGSCIGAPGPNAAIPDADEDPDGDGLTNIQEHGASTHPLCPDTDQAGLVDGDEVAFGLVAVDPLDDFFEDGQDQDGDGLTDLVERRQAGTAPRNADTDGDGLLDGPSMPRTGCWDATDPRALRFIDLGIAFEATGSAADRCYRFLGEHDLGTDPRQADPGGHGVPQGWLVVHGMDPVHPDDPAKARRAYELNRPTWWQTSLHGVWWGGASPAEVDAPAQGSDLDLDGLVDGDGEDPWPGYNHFNMLRAIEPDIHGLDAWPALHPTEAADPLVSRLLAQAVINPLHLDGRHGRHPDPASLRHTDTHTTRGEATLQAVLHDPELERGGTATLTGLVELAGQGVGGITVVAHIAGEMVGAAFTTADGSFVMAVKLQASHEATIPPEAFVLLGQQRGTVSWAADVAALPLGHATLEVRTYATPDTRPHIERWPAMHAAQASLPMVITANAAVHLEHPGPLGTSQEVVVPIHVADAGGAPLSDPVDVTVLAADTAIHQARVAPDSKGNGEVRFTVPHARAGPLALHATTDPTSQWVTQASASLALHARIPTTLTVHEPPPARAGEAVIVVGLLGSPPGPVSGTQVHVRFGEAMAAATTGADGRFEALLDIPPQATGGAHALLMEAEAGVKTAAASGSTILHVQGVPRFVLEDGPVEAGGAIPVEGVLLRPDGAPMAGVHVGYEVAGSTGTSTTGPDGAFSASADASAAPSPVTIHVTFAGDDRHAPVAASVQRVLLSGTTLHVADGSVVRGEPASVNATLQDALHRPIEGASLLFSWGTTTRHAVTDAAGRATFPYATDEATPVGAHNVRVTYAGSGDGTLLASTGDATWLVLAEVRFELPPGPWVAGQAVQDGRVVDAATGQALAGAAVEVHATGRGLRHVVTAEDGTFPIIEHPPNDASPGPLHLDVVFPAQGPYVRHGQAASVILQSPVSIESEVGPFVVGGATAIRITVEDAGGRPAPGVVAILLEGSHLADAALHAGHAFAEVTVPADMPAGPATLSLQYLGTDLHPAADVHLPVHVREPVELVVTVEQVGRHARVVVTALGSGQVLAFRDVHLVLEGMPGGLAQRTDDAGRATFLIPLENASRRFSVRLDASDHHAPALALLDIDPHSPATAPGSTTYWPWPVALAFAALVTAVWLWRRRSELESEFREAARSLTARGPVELAILSAYESLQASALRHKWLEDRAPTPRALQASLRRVVPAVAHPDLETLVSLFEEARYAETRMMPPHRLAAQRALARITRSLAWEATT